MCVLFQIQSLALDVTFVHVSQTFYSTLVIKWGYFYTALERPFSIGVSPPPQYILLSLFATYRNVWICIVLIICSN